MQWTRDILSLIVARESHLDAAIHVLYRHLRARNYRTGSIANRADIRERKKPGYPLKGSAPLPAALHCCRMKLVSALRSRNASVPPSLVVE